MHPIQSAAIILTCTSSSAFASVPIFSPDTATAGSEFSGSYHIENAIDGTGLEVDFCPESPHFTYVANNHWTTQSGALQADTAFANFFFDNDQTIATFLLWNHRSNGVASDPGYAVTEFDLRLYDGEGTVLFESLGVPATPNVLTSQAYRFGPIDNVRRVEFVIQANNGSPQYTGVAEVAFSAETYCAGDLDGNGLVDSDDLSQLLTAFGNSDAGDITCDGVTDSDDLSALLVAFGDSCEAI